MKRPTPTPPESCPVCGADLPRQAKACPECGADHETGWSEDAYASGLDLPQDDDFDYEAFVKKEFDGPAEIKPRHLPWFWWVIGLLLILGLSYWSLAKFF